MSDKSIKLSSINCSAEATWTDKLVITFDVDWAHDKIISDTHELLLAYRLQSTWFITHNSKYLNVLRSDPCVELGIHPNFNCLLAGKDKDISSHMVLSRLKEIVPEATAVRSHSLVQSERLVDQFLEVGLTHSSNTYLPYSSRLPLYPYRLWGGMTIVPHGYQDNAALRTNDEFPGLKAFEVGLHVFDFHPIHVFLNTESLDRYERTRSMHKNPEELIKHRYEGSGTRTRLIALLRLAGSLGAVDLVPDRSNLQIINNVTI